MHLLVSIINNVKEWKESKLFNNKDKPVLPVPYNFGGSFLNADHVLSAVDYYSAANKKNSFPFKSIYYKNEIDNALDSVDISVLWGSFGLITLLKQTFNPKSKNNVIYFTFIFRSKKFNLKHSFNDLLVKALSKNIKGLVLMTGEQVRKARHFLGNRTKVIQVRIGIDTSFYRASISEKDIPNHFYDNIKSLLAEPYVIMPGDELRINDDAIHFVKKTGIKLIRVSQYGDKNNINRLIKKIKEHGLSKNLIILENISYTFLRFLLRNASAYVGFVDSSWQPAGWTVACEALASGLPIVLYEGLVSKEMKEIGAPSNYVFSCPQGNLNSFLNITVSLIKSDHKKKFSDDIAKFAKENLDFKITAPLFVKEVEKLLHPKKK